MGWYFLIVNRKPVPEVRLLERSRLTTPSAEQRRPPEQCGRSALSGAAGASRTARHGPARLWAQRRLRGMRICHCGSFSLCAVAFSARGSALLAPWVTRRPCLLFVLFPPKKKIQSKHFTAQRVRVRCRAVPYRLCAVPYRLRAVPCRAIPAPCRQRPPWLSGGRGLPGAGRGYSEERVCSYASVPV